MNKKSVYFSFLFQCCRVHDFFFLLIKVLVEDIERRICIFTMAGICAFLSVENDHFKLLVCNCGLRKSDEDKKQSWKE